MYETITLLFLLLGAHWICDYPLQGDFLAKAKFEGPLRVYHLLAHSGIQGAAVTLVTGSLWLGLAEWFIHTVTDELKVRGRTTFAQDQAIHVTCKVLWVALFAMGVS